MTQFNPITGAILANQLVSPRQAADKASQIRREQVLAKNVAAQGDRFESEVEAADKIDPAHEDNRKQQNPRGQKKRDEPHADDHPHPDGDAHMLDVTA